MAPEHSNIALSLAGVPAAHRFAVLREDLGPAFNMDFTVSSATVELDAVGWLLPQVSWLHASHSALSAKRLNLTLGTDDFELVWPGLSVSGVMRHLGREVDGKSGQATLMSRADQFDATMDDGFQHTMIGVDRALLMPLLPHAEDALMRPIARDQPAFRLLRTYLDVLARDEGLRAPETARAVAAHIADLVALAVGTTRDAGVLAASRGLRAARLEAVKSWTRERLHQPHVSVVGAARAQDVSPRYVQMLFETEGVTFSEFLLKERLAYACRLLANQALVFRSISAIAYDAGFSDLSYFNRSFRAAFGETPTDFRHRTAIRDDRG